VDPCWRRSVPRRRSALTRCWATSTLVPDAPRRSTGISMGISFDREDPAGLAGFGGDVGVRVRARSCSTEPRNALPSTGLAGDRPGRREVQDRGLAPAAVARVPRRRRHLAVEVRAVPGTVEVVRVPQVRGEAGAAEPAGARPPPGARIDQERMVAGQAPPLVGPGGDFGAVAVGFAVELNQPAVRSAEAVGPVVEVTGLAAPSRMKW
jgi:hypothetical protein